MAKKNQKFEKQDEQLESVNQTLTGAGKWIEEHSNMLTACVVGIAVVILGVMLLNQKVFKPKALEASNENAKAVVYFMQGDYDRALNGDSVDCSGFLEVADEYGFYQEGKLAALYAGICYYEKGEYESAVEYLKKFSADDLTIAPAAKQLLGDAYIELQDYANAIKAFEAAAKSGNELIAPMSLKKAGLAYLHEENKSKALKAFKTIKEKYPSSAEAQDIDKYIAIAE
ncbi:MAG: tetratricopeptide repeat protein [Paludibacteraceae bacterium]|nr:tetratricopeptide repeat protein [Paludibacteraceae bacterium]MBQ5379737.1 tetratricopeptide repeat protein [Paludibacteraceae bacterium]